MNETFAKKSTPFRFRDRSEKEAFFGQLSDIIDESRFILISCVIDKRRLGGEHADENPYHVALSHCLDSLSLLLKEKEEEDCETCIVFEARGPKEDRELELEFRRICDGENSEERRLPFRIVFADKKVNSAGLQLADLVARPIGINYLRPNQKSRAFEVLAKKFLDRDGRKNAGRNYKGYGLKIFPSPKSEKPR